MRRSDPRRRVVVTGMGAVTPLGQTVAACWQAQLESRSGIKPIQRFDASTFPTQIAGEVTDWNFGAWATRDARLAQAGLNTQFAIVATEEAMRQAQLADGQVNPERLGIYFAAGDGASDLDGFIRIFLKSWDRQGQTLDVPAYLGESLTQFRPEREVEQEPYSTIWHLARLFRAYGPFSNCLTACAASSQSVGEAMEIIRRGDADLMITGGTHSMIHPFGMAGFCLLTTLSTRNDEPQRASRPFDRLRDGFVMAEGAAVLILEELDHARRRGAAICGELVGYGSTADAYRLTDTHPEGKGAIKAMALALHDAGLRPRDMDYINAHGTSTQLNDQIETRAIKQVMAEDAKRIPVSSTKSMMGHLIAASGAVELISTILAIRDQILPPTINYEEPDPMCDLDYVPNEARPARVRAAMSNSFGFGGQNVCLVVKAFEP